MLFTDTVFLFYFLPVAILVHALCVSRTRQGEPYPAAAKLSLFLLTLVFYGFRQPWWLVPFIAGLSLDYLWARLIGGEQRRHRRKAYLFASIAQNLALFAFFKYSQSIHESLRSWLPEAAAWMPQLYENTEYAALPAGLSFYLLESMSMVFDVYRREIAPPRRLLDMLAFVGCFPRLVAGPIARFGPVSRQFEQYRGMSVESGLHTFAGGFFLKAGFADSFGIFAKYAFNQTADLDFVSAWLGAISYMMQVYFDFAGYSLMAIGLGRCLGFEFPQNFRSPYLATSLTEFWSRWHITLGAWVREYLYFPLAVRLRKRAWGRYVALFVTMMLLALWHGCTPTFIALGIWWGGCLCLEVALRLPERLSPALCRLYTLASVTGASVLFGSRDLAEAAKILGAMLRPWAGLERFTADALVANPLSALLALAGLLYAFGWEAQWPLWQPKRNWATAAGAFALVLLALVMAHSARLVPFLYFQF